VCHMSGFQRRRTSSSCISGIALALFSSALLAMRWKENRDVRFVFNRSTKLELEGMNQLRDCEPRAWMLFHRGLE
jgi:hypothetical protein